MVAVIDVDPPTSGTPHTCRVADGSRVHPSIDNVAAEGKQEVTEDTSGGIDEINHADQDSGEGSNRCCNWIRSHKICTIIIAMLVLVTITIAASARPDITDITGTCSNFVQLPEESKSSCTQISDNTVQCNTKKDKNNEVNIR